MESDGFYPSWALDSHQPPLSVCQVVPEHQQIRRDPSFLETSISLQSSEPAMVRGSTFPSACPMTVTITTNTKTQTHWNILKNRFVRDSNIQHWTCTDSDIGAQKWCYLQFNRLTLQQIQKFKPTNKSDGCNGTLTARVGRVDGCLDILLLCVDALTQFWTTMRTLSSLTRRSMSWMSPTQKWRLTWWICTLRWAQLLRSLRCSQQGENDTLKILYIEETLPFDGRIKIEHRKIPGCRERSVQDGYYTDQ